jgi:hypothetical protein
MKIQFLIEVEAPAVARNSAAVQADLRQLLMDSVESCLQRNPNFQLRTGIKESRGPVTCLLTKADLAQFYQTTDRSIARWTKQGKLPEPIRVAAPHCTNGSPRWFPEDIPTRPLTVKWENAA